MYYGIFYHPVQNEPVGITMTQEYKFEECCNSMPTSWAHLIHIPTGKVTQSWSEGKLNVL